MAYNRVALAGIAAEAERLQVADGIRAALIVGDDVVQLQGPLVRGLLSNSPGSTALATAPGPCEHPVLDRAADRAAMAAAVRKHLLAALGPEGIQPQAAQLQQLIALAVAQLYC